MVLKQIISSKYLYIIIAFSFIYLLEPDRISNKNANVSPLKKLKTQTTFSMN